MRKPASPRQRLDKGIYIWYLFSKILLNLVKFLPRRPGRAVLAAGAALFLAAAPALAQTDHLDVGLHYNYSLPQIDLSPMDPGQSYGLVAHYWVNDTTTIDAQFDQITGVWPLEVVTVKDHVRSTESEDTDFQMWLVSGGARYAPEVDFFLRPYAGLGLGYGQWTANSSVKGVGKREGSGLGVYGLLGAEYRLTRRLAVGPYCRFVFTPFSSKMEEEVLINQDTDQRFMDKTRLEQGGFLLTGVSLTVRIR